VKNLIKLLIFINIFANISAASESLSLEALGRRYVAFMQSLGEEGATTYESQAPEIFAEQVSKIVNDRQILTARIELLKQLRDAREIAYPCTFTIQKIFCDVAKKACTIHFTWNSEKLGLHKTVVSLNFDENNLITEIDEVYNAAGIHLSNSKKPIAELATAYNEFQHSYGQSEEKDYPAVIEKLFSPGFEKTANTQRLVNGRDNLEPQLSSVRAAAEGWNILVKEMIPSADNKKCIISYSLVSKKLGTFDIIAILTSSDGAHIDSVTEVYSVIENAKT